MVIDAVDNLTLIYNLLGYEPQNILDIGGGNYKNINNIVVRNNGNFEKAVLIDKDNLLCENCHKKTTKFGVDKKMEFRKGFIENLALDNNVYDLIISENCLHFIKNNNRINVYKKIINALKNDEILYLTMKRNKRHENNKFFNHNGYYFFDIPDFQWFRKNTTIIKAIRNENYINLIVSKKQKTTHGHRHNIQ